MLKNVKKTTLNLTSRKNKRIILKYSYYNHSNIYPLEHVQVSAPVHVPPTPHPPVQ